MSSARSLDDALKAAELRKLGWEIVRLRRRPAWHEVAQQFVPLLTALIAVLGFIWGINEFANEQAVQQKKLAFDLQTHSETLEEQRADRAMKSEQEFRHRFWEERLKIYREVTQITGTLASSRDAEILQAKEAEFWTLYWGEMSVIEDRVVLEAMQAFGETLHHSRPQPNGDPAGAATDNSELKKRAYSLARACRKSLNDTWEVIQLDPFPEAAPLFK